MTLSYRLDMFGRADPELVRAAPRPYEALVLCAPDFPSCKTEPDAMRLSDSNSTPGMRLNLPLAVFLA
jgi:hypothetical protein